ncbi:MAG: TlpA family protein disulfide reductase [Bacteroidetes bacterium]|nr:TlpA family protein disulfide reductase [Bacteroidota bacterium]
MICCRLFLTFLLLLIPLFSLPQRIQGVIADSAVKSCHMILESVFGNDLIIIDSCLIDRLGSFVFPEKKYPVGFYRLSLSDTNSVELIINPSEPVIELYFKNTKLRESIHVINSLENRLLWLNKSNSKDILQEKKKIFILRSYARKNNPDEFEELSRDLEKLDSIDRQFVSDLVGKYPDTYFSKIAGLSLLGRKTCKEGYFDDIDFNDTSLMRSPAIPIRIMDYLVRFTEYDEVGFKASIDYILHLASANQPMYELSLNYLLSLFNDTGPEIIFQYLVENYLLSDGCGADYINDDIEKKAFDYRQIQPGSKAPDFEIHSENGMDINLSDQVLKCEYTLILFWSSHCPFCREVIPALDSSLLLNVEKRGKDFIQVLAFSLDTGKRDWGEAIENEGKNFLHYCDLKGWDSPVVRLYKVHKTPACFLIGRDGRIIARPSRPEEIRRLFP